MEFCKECENMLYLKLDEADALVLHCKYCGQEQPTPAERVYELANTRVDDYTNYKLYVTPNIVHDPTLPRVNNIPCPNDACPTKSSKKLEGEVIYVKYDAKNMKYLYYCVHCASFWKTK